MEHGLPEPADVIAGKYTVERTLGRGGMGAVYVVSHKLTGKRLALKCLLPEFVQNHVVVERFLREAQATGRIEHRNVVNVFDAGRDGDTLYLVMELLDGKPLSALLQDEALTLEEALAIIVRAMHGVAAAHAQGVIHRDLKPDNIFACRGAAGRLDDPRVLDFGISKLDDGETGRLTRSGVAMGTPYYMSLEQLSGNTDLDARVDVYAMGVILYEAISGLPPHTADSVAALAIKVLTVAPVSLSALRPDLPPGLGDVVMRAIVRDREERYPSIQALIEAIQPFIPQGAGLLVPEGQGRPLRTPRGATPSGSSASQAAFASQMAGAPSAPPDAGGEGLRSAVVWASAGACLTIVIGVASAYLLSEALSSGPASSPIAKPAADDKRVGSPTAEPQARLTIEPPVAQPSEHVAHAEASKDAGADALDQLVESDVRAGGAGPRSGARSADGHGRHAKAVKAGTPVPMPSAIVTDAAGAKPVPTPAEAPAEQAKTPTTAQGRAGTIGADDF